MQLILKQIILSILVIATTVTSFAGKASAKPLAVFVSILPQKTIVEQIGGKLVSVQVMVPPGAGPATYEPKPSQMARLSRTSIYFSVGVPFEKAWLPKIGGANPKMEIVPTDQDIPKLPMARHEHEGHEEDHHDHGHEEAHTLDPHVWLSPGLIKMMARNIQVALIRQLPDHRDQLKTNLTTFENELDHVDQQIRQLLTPLKGRHFMTFHPSWGYFAHTYGLTQIPVEVEGKEPKPAQLKDIIRNAEKLNIKAIFVQPQFSTRTARIIADMIGGRLITADPLAPDLLDNLLRQARALEKALR